MGRQGSRVRARPRPRTAYCDLKTGKPIPGKAHASGIPVFP
jgi:hypothetical protein